MLVLEVMIDCSIASYIFKAIEIDRRYSKTLSTLELDSEVLNNIIQLSAEADSADEGECLLCRCHSFFSY